MQPSSDQTNRGGVQVPSRQGQTITPPSSRDAAANLMRQQIDKIYDEPQPNEQIAAGQTLAQPTNSPYEQTHSDAADIQAETQNVAIQDHWLKYHSAWQQYYQMYYERYYLAQIQQKSAEQTSNEPAKAKETTVEPNEFLTEEQAVTELRSELLNKVRTHSKKIRKSRHFMPAVMAVAVALIFIFLQYNQIIFANVMAYTTPSLSESVNNYIDPNTDVNVGQEPILKIPKIGVESPVIYGLTSLSESVVQDKLRGGVVHYPVTGAEAVPGQIGNTVILGHSANDVFTDGNYKFIFLRLDNLVQGDSFYLNYQGKRYTYLVTEKKVIAPNQINELVINNGKPMATLVTCTPIGTSTNRLLVIGEQVSPDPAQASTPSGSSESINQTNNIGGNNKTIFERLFGGN